MFVLGNLPTPDTYVLTFSRPGYGAQTTLVPGSDLVVNALSANEVRDIAIVTGYLASHIDDWCALHMRERPEMHLSTLHQAELNGTAGAMLLARNFLLDESAFIFGWGDILMDDENYTRFVHSARTESYDLLLAVNATSDPWRGAAVYVDHDMRVEKIVEKPTPGTSTRC